MLQQFFLIVLCPHKDKIILHCINDILSDSLRRIKLYAIRILFLNFLEF